VHICIKPAGGSGVACILPGRQALVMGSQKLPALITRRRHQMRIWVRAFDMGYAPGADVAASFELSQDGCTGSSASCVEDTAVVHTLAAADPGCHERPGLYTRSTSGAPAVALTFDDGPGPQTTEILNTLSQLHAPATFYINGTRVDISGKRALRRMRAQGDEIGNHSWAHENLPGTE
jgi:hypothetical protein